MRKEAADESLQFFSGSRQQRGSPQDGGAASDLQRHPRRLLSSAYRGIATSPPPVAGRKNHSEGCATLQSPPFDYATFSGEFTRRRDDALLAHSGLICLDFDHIDQWHDGGRLSGVYGLRYALMHDAAVDTALLFRSPGGDGLKWVVPIDLAQGTHADWFEILSFYVSRNYGVEPDPSGRDLSRACYLPWDPDVVMMK